MNQMTDNTVYAGGFANPSVASAHGFRAAMNAMARPGAVQGITGAIPPEGISHAAGSLLLTLCDPETSVFLAPDVDSEALRGWLTFHTGAPIVSAEQADFALGGWGALMPLDRFPIGTAEYPDRSTTLIVEVAGFDATNATLSGPGIKDTAQMALPDPVACAGNAMLYPLGVDFFFTSGSQVAALPRSTQIRAEA
ncbi:MULTISPECIES: phosphonate C-P lyase system protein PhnH [Rhodobacterales]|jgi:alpha-D-ribose 1-methylphosphonate 5-triphosphate synthase subunit PhnH|uniref:phosphonate C-P lyase system protein PhnH n=1 Tax=Rhodobacterales TaxID=204455 RepID=UPI00237F6F3C|nr:phosphonate C-P lyase system protein PhnH [Phaeobacter gallaeciensis]MDE4141142.1 phosphonate C-P lyase system protein PhnH [Phaeobacter gallaeciensis]MDE4149587.1 phosphonate C-P lyase system protein PhnH [Phaeobacter gallaeciensis]MDE4153963.1 phosphonate C-P lyase system protein PhnH [Phaeobacter gallaeciensis]MDE4229355.1 phosphonate C-P lyase system protein PhnH [Phaeobacter gallaeciensis]MDE4258277.1 phosphonate C-P lyase system protein PhnH [Phaeobacter gallaeciensis]